MWRVQITGLLFQGCNRNSDQFLKLMKRSPTKGRRHLHMDKYPQRLVYLCHSANAEDTILAGGSAASPKAPPYGSL